jgi:regulator of sigma E protease
MLSTLITALEFIIVLAVLVFVHELGHFIFAKLCKVRVDQFALGFGPKIFCKKYGETEYKINIFPLGGYVKIVGENPDDPIPEGLDKSRVFNYQNRFKQFLILFGGVLFNFIFAYLLYSCSFMIGFTASPDSFSEYKDRFENQRVIITEVTSGSPAQKAGFEIGDSILGTNSQPQIEAIQKMINDSQGKEIYLDVKNINSDNTRRINVVPQKGIIEDKYAIGIAMSEAVDLRLPFFSALKTSIMYTREMIVGMTGSLYDFIKTAVVGKANLDQVMGPVGIAGIVGNAAKSGISYLFMITALISINLGIINLLPFPALDGGRILFVFIEAIIRRPISHKFQNIVNAVGFVLLMALMVIVTFKDIIRIFK